MANVDKPSTCADQQQTSQGRTAGEISPIAAKTCSRLCVDYRNLNKHANMDDKETVQLDEQDNIDHNDSQSHSRKHKRKQREPRRISNPTMPQIVKQEPVEDHADAESPNKTQEVCRVAGSQFEFTESDEETPDYINNNRNKFRPISPTLEGQDPFRFHSPDNEDDDVDIGLHESMSGGSHGSPTSEDGEHHLRTGRGSKKAQRSYKNLSRSRRIVANARERNRVHTISAAFEGLRRAVPSYSHNQKLSKLAILRIACSYILALANLADKDYTPDQSQLSFGDCVDMCTKTLQSEGRSKRRKELTESST